MKISRNAGKQIGVLISIQIILIVTSVLILTVYESQSTLVGNSINVSGKNRFYAEAVTLEISKYRLGDIFRATPILHLSLLNDNLKILKNGGSDGILEVSPLPKEFEAKYKMLHDEYVQFAGVVREVSNIKDSGNEVSELDVLRVEYSEGNILKYSDDLTNSLSEYAESRSEYQIFLQIVLSGINVGTHFFLIVLILRILNSEFDNKIKLENQLATLEEKNKNFETVQKFNKELNDFKNAIDKVAIIAITDTKGNITYANSAFCKISKYTEKELIGKNHRMLKSGQHSEEFYKDMWNTISNGKTWNGTIKNRAKDGTFYWVETSIVPIFDDGKIIEYVSVRIDVTKEKELERELQRKQKFALIGDLSSRLAHDIRNPLSIIRVSLENLINEYGSNEKTKRHFEKVDRSIDRISHQINDVLGFIKQESISFEKTMLSEVISDALDSVNIPDTISIDLPKQDVAISCNRKTLSIALTNLILNAVQATNEKGTIKIDFEDSEDNLKIKIEDSGKGISKENLPHIFEPLFTTKQKGIGLGLVSVKSIVEAHGGTISVTSPPTIFTITLPR